MYYTIDEQEKIRSSLIQKLQLRINEAFANDTIDKLMNEFGVAVKTNEPSFEFPINPKSKILVFGALSGQKYDFLSRARKLGIKEGTIVFIDYAEAARYNAETLKNNYRFSDIIYGPTPHKTQNMGKCSSLLTAIKKEPNNYPKLHTCEVNGKLKITPGNFTKLLSETDYYQKIVCLEQYY